jgi:1-deoxy-D-xylulose-5-phosphate synthase
MPHLQKLINRAEESFKNLIVPGVLFEELGFRYFGPLDGHDVILMTQSLKNILGLKGPRILHILTRKGMGCELAEKDPERLHGISKQETTKVESRSHPEQPARSYTAVFSDLILRAASRDKKIVAITAAMPTGTGLDLFQKTFPERFFDVGIAEEHAVTFAGALAKGGLKPVCALYSTFSQRAVDQLFHDVALQEQGLVLALDRAGVVGEDGPTHHGLFDISFLRPIPGSILASPKDSIEMERMLELGLKAKNVFAIRYPRGRIPKEFTKSSRTFEVGEAEVLREGEDATLVTLGPLVAAACEAAERLELQGISCGVVNMRFAKPLDQKLLRTLIHKDHLIVTLEDHVLTGGFGACVLEALCEMGLDGARVIRLGFEEKFIPHASREELLEDAGLSPDKITARILKEIKST